MLGAHVHGVRGDNRARRASGSPVFVLTSKRGKLLEEMSSRMRWPAQKRLAVSGAVTSIS